MAEIAANIFSCNKVKHKSIKENTYEINLTPEDLNQKVWQYHNVESDCDWPCIRVLNWNIRGFESNKEVFTELVDTYKVNTCLLQETFKTFDQDIFN
jgi:hypothetical protein